MKADVATMARIPGRAEVWVLLACDLFIFSLGFLLFLYYQHQQPDVFASASQSLNYTTGLVNTVLLLTSSLFVAKAVRHLALGTGRSVSFFNMAFACGVGFIIIKTYEYAEKVTSGVTFLTNDFYMLYFGLTGTHMVHVLMGLVVLRWAASRAAVTKVSDSEQITRIEQGGLFWHLVDLLWIVLFALFYLVG